MTHDQALKELPRVAGQLLPRCALCEEVPPRGIAGGYLIKGMFLCETCESTILNLKVGSHQYELYMERIKKLLR